MIYYLHLLSPLGDEGRLKKVERCDLSLGDTPHGVWGLRFFSCDNMEGNESWILYILGVVWVGKESLK